VVLYESIMSSADLELRADWTIGFDLEAIETLLIWGGAVSVVIVAIIGKTKPLLE